MDSLDPDGALTAERDEQRRRGAELRTRPDGSGELHAHLTPAALASWQVLLDAWSALVPAVDGARDPRAGGQRRHDALHDIAAHLLRCDTDLPASGAAATVLLTMTLDQLEARTGLVTTGHGGHLTVDAALRIASEAQLLPIVLDRRGVLGYGHARRYASPGQTSPSPPETAAAHSPAATGPRLVRTPPHHPLARRRTHRPEQPHPAVWLPPPRVPATRLDLPNDRRPTPLDPTGMARPHPDTPHQPCSRAVLRHRPGLTSERGGMGPAPDATKARHPCAGKQARGLKPHVTRGRAEA